MELHEIKDLLDKIHGCTFASLDANTMEGGIRRVVTNESVILFTNKGGSGYEGMVRRRLAEAGLDPSGFVLSELPWGERVEGTPLIYHKHKDRHYLQTILLKPGRVQAFINDTELDPDVLKKPGGRNQGLPDDRRVVVQTYGLDNILALRLMGEERISGTLGIRL